MVIEKLRLRPVEELSKFNWILLESVPKWDKIDESCRILIDKGMFDSKKHQQLFKNFNE